MHASCYLTALAATATASPIAVKARQSTCTSDQRLAGAALVISSYNAVQPGDTAACFANLPLEPYCKTYINPNGGPAVPVAGDATSTKDFALATRQVFSQVTGKFDDYANGTTIIHTYVTLGAAHAASIPVTFSADVFLDYNLEDCLIGKIQAFATVPSVVVGMHVTPPDISGLTTALDNAGLSDLAGNLKSGLLGEK